MLVKALCLGSIGVVAETSDRQRQAFNAAFAAAGLDWNWDAGTYRQLLARQGGEDRIARYAAQRNDDVDTAHLHLEKARLYSEDLVANGLEPRPGIKALIEAANARGIPVAFVTTTDRSNIDAILQATGLGADSFAVIVDRTMVQAKKPSPDAYGLALARLDAAAGDALAIEDTPESAASPMAAGIRTIGFPGAFAVGRPFPDGVEVHDALTADLLG